MSGSNPFRRSRLLAQESTSASSVNIRNAPSHTSGPSKPVRSFPAVNVLGNDGSPRPSSSSSRVKIVRIASPPVPASFDDLPHDADLETPPPFVGLRTSTNSPSLPRADHGSGIDPFGAEISDGDVSEDEETMDHSTSPPLHMTPPTTSFRNTLFKENIMNETSASRSAASGSQRTSARTPLDVDAFTRLLLTGERTSTSPTALKPPVATRAHGTVLSENSSFTDVSSISRQSIFEPLHEAETESPRTSHEMFVDDEDRRKLTGKKPPPPKTRHGKLIKNVNLPAIATSSEPSSSNPPTLQPSPVDAVSPGLSPASTNHHKLPCSPQVAKSPSSTTVTSPKDHAHSPKRPPTPPLARRRSTKHAIDPSIHSAQPIERAASIRSISTTDSHGRIPAPPPPPSRHHRASTNSSITVPSESTPEEELRYKQSHVSRNVSVSSRLSGRSSQKPPPPPPPRNSRVHVSSLSSQHAQPGSDSGRDIRNMSLQSPAEITTEAVAAPGSVGDQSSKDASVHVPSRRSAAILLDLSALQREIDDALKTGNASQRKASAESGKGD